MKFAPEGYPFIISACLLSGVAAVILLWVIRHADSSISITLASVFFGTSLLLVFFMAFFFRDPDRVIPAGEGIFVSPADGKVIGIRDVSDQQFTGAGATEISIFMSPLDVHVNRSPCDGRVMAVRHSPGIFMAAYRDDASLRNENIVMLLETGHGNVLVRQVAGFVARRAVCRVREGDVLKRGERYGIIKFSSRLDMYLPKDAEIKVALGERVKAGETVVAKAKKQ
jgi:phosphatidylserine decarboxylase